VCEEEVDARVGETEGGSWSGMGAIGALLDEEASADMLRICSSGLELERLCRV
jgi:hypothetical protein